MNMSVRFYRELTLAHTHYTLNTHTHSKHSRLLKIKSNLVPNVNCKFYIYLTCGGAQHSTKSTHCSAYGSLNPISHISKFY